MAEEKRRLTDLEAEERAAEAEAILNNHVFKQAVDDVYSRQLGILVTSDVGSLTASAAHATIKSVREVQNQLEQYVTERKMRSKFGKG